jgi:cytoskeletal protein RodZ
MSDVDARPRRRKVGWIALAAAVLLIVIIVVIGVSNRDPEIVAGPSPATPASASTAPSISGSGSTAPSPNGSASTGGMSAAPTTPVPKASVPSPTATGEPTVVPTEPVQSTTVPLDKTAPAGKDVVVQVTKFEGVKGKAQGPGEVAGPALRVTVKVGNRTTKPLPMNLALVNLYYGKDATPASALSGPGMQPLSKPVRAGTSAAGRYVFSVPKSEQGFVTVEFSYTTDAPTVVFSGSR